MIDSNEMLFVVDEENNPLEPLSRTVVHDNGLWHRVSLVWIINHNQQILCQKRTIHKDTNPGKWELRFGGHLSPSDEYADAAMRELQEETGLSIKKDDLQFLGVYKHTGDHQIFGANFYIKWSGDISALNIQKDEVDQVRWLSIEEIEDIYLRDDMDWVAKTDYEAELFSVLKKV